MKRLGFALSALCLLAAGVMPAMASDRQCVASAREGFLMCKGECIDEFRSSKFLCHDVEPACGRRCLGQRESCMEAAMQPLEECLAPCRESLQGTKVVCADTCGVDAACLDACVDSAQVDAFMCRDTCREDFHTNGGHAAVEQCQMDFRACVALCSPGASEPH